MRYRRTYQGLPVRGGDFVVHNAPGGAFAGANTAQSAPIAIPGTTAALSPARARSTALGGSR